jgi:putative peptidoglycan lipid II flippase
MIRLVLPRIFGASAGQLVLLIDTMIASTLAVGSITILNYAINLQSLPLGMVGISIAVASFATLSELAGQNNQAAFVTEIKNNLRRVLYIIIPASFGLFLIRFEIVQLILRTGKFTGADSIMTAQALGIFAFGLIAQSLIPLLARAFYAFHNTKIPVTIGLVSVLLNIIVSNIIYTKNYVLSYRI